MKKLAIILLTAGLALSAGAFAEEGSGSNNNGNANASDSPGSMQKLAPNGVDNSKINTSNTNVAQQSPHKKPPRCIIKPVKIKTIKLPCVKTAVAQIRFQAPSSQPIPANNTSRFTGN